MSNEVSRIAKVCFPYKWARLYDYLLTVDACIGDVVLAPVKNRLVPGVIFAIEKTTDFKELKQINEVSAIRLPQRFLDFLLQVSEDNLLSLGSALNLGWRVFKQTIMPEELHEYYEENERQHTIESLNAQISYQTWKKQARQGKLIKKNFNDVLQDLSFDYLMDDQRRAVEVIHSLNDFQTCLLEGQTGSGKTEVFLDAIFERSKTSQILILVPEIALTTSFLKRFEKRFGVQPLVWHSMSSKTGKDAVFSWAISGRPGVVVGARSALFIPFCNLGMIVMDEEHDLSYKQTEGVRYHGKKASLALARIHNCPIIFVSATPSLDFRITNPHQHIILERTQKHGQAQVEIIDNLYTKAISAAKIITNNNRSNIAQSQWAFSTLSPENNLYSFKEK